MPNIGPPNPRGLLPVAAILLHPTLAADTRASQALADRLGLQLAVSIQGASLEPAEARLTPNPAAAHLLRVAGGAA